MGVPIYFDGAAIRAPIRVTPGAKRAGWKPYREDAPWLAACVTAPPEDGKANAALLELLAQTLRLPVSRMSVIRGGSHRQKTVEILCDDLPTALATLAQATGAPAVEAAFTVVRRAAGG